MGKRPSRDSQKQVAYLETGLSAALRAVYARFCLSINLIAGGTNPLSAVAVLYAFASPFAGIASTAAAGRRDVPLRRATLLTQSAGSGTPYAPL
jgi:hypothetical protein